MSAIELAQDNSKAKLPVDWQPVVAKCTGRLQPGGYYSEAEASTYSHPCHGWCTRVKVAAVSCGILVIGVMVCSFFRSLQRFPVQASCSKYPGPGCHAGVISSPPWWQGRWWSMQCRRYFTNFFVTWFTGLDRLHTATEPLTSPFFATLLQNDTPPLITPRPLPNRSRAFVQYPRCPSPPLQSRHKGPGSDHDKAR